MSDEEEIDLLMNYLIENEMIEFAGFDSITNQITYRFTEKCKEILPELVNEHLSFVNEMAFELWQKGYIEIRFDQEDGPMVMLKDIDYKKDVFPLISDEERFFIENMINLSEN
jgi:hypothetical protein